MRSLNHAACNKFNSTTLTLVLGLILWHPLAAAVDTGPDPAAAVRGAFERVREAVFSDPYQQRPLYPVNRHLFGASGDSPDNALRAAARRTLSTEADLVDFPHGRKLFQPNGICYEGRWQITADTGFTGAFGAGVSLPAIVRISVMLGAVSAGQRRTLAMGIKLFSAVADPAARSADLLVMDAIAGSRRRYTADAVLDNHPDFGGLPAFGEWRTALRIRADMDAVDADLSPAGPALRYRDVRAGAVLLPASDGRSRAPHWLRLRVAQGTPRIDAVDFRDELATAAYPDARLIYVIELAAHAQGGKSAARWQRAGELELSASTVSATCDRRLHFAHPRLAQPP